MISLPTVQAAGVALPTPSSRLLRQGHFLTKRDRGILYKVAFTVGIWLPCSSRVLPQRYNLDARKPAFLIASLYPIHA